MDANTFVSVRLVSPVGIGASVITMPMDTMLRKKTSRYFFTASLFFFKNLNMKAPRAPLKPSYYSGECLIGATRGRDFTNY
jgi:hypothetical protein